MSRLLNTGISSLTANQASLQTTGHNIANVNTAGYSRQTVAVKAIPGQNLGNGYIGSGVSVATVMRNYSELLNKQSVAAQAASAGDAARSQSLTQMQDVFTGGDAGLGAAISNMMNAFVDLETSPTDAAARNVALTRIAELASRFRASAASLDEQDYNTKAQITNDVTLVNSLADQVATLNGQISRALATGHTPNDLMDRRDQLVREINQYVKTSEVRADDGSISLFVGGSQPLVMGSITGQLSVSESKIFPGSGKLSLYYSQANSDPVELTASFVGGGEIAGLLQFNNDDLVEGRNLLGRLAVAIGSELNKQNNLGLTLSGETGTNLFQLPTEVSGFSNITGYILGSPSSASLSFTDSKALVASDYQVVFGASHPTDTRLVRLSDGKTSSISSLSNYSSTPGGSTTFTADGLTFSLDATASSGSDGQSILFKPFGSAASDIKALIYTPDDLAVSNAISAEISADNRGTLQLSGLKAVATDIPTVGTPVTLTFAVDAVTGNISFTSDGVTYTPYKSGEHIAIDGWKITLSGTPKSGDKVIVSNALEPGFSDSWKRNAGNASAFLALRDMQIFDNGTTLTDGFSSAMAVIGTRAQSAKYAAGLSASVAQSLENDRTAVSGVNLDEEAARLLQFQQSYQASAKVIQIAQSLFDSILSAVNR